ncbi:hypothetical protein GCM10008110_11420 [Marinobacter persicus]|nr:hypothetical protein GCM10008110_11420 [Marinobacter persicus]
MDEKHSGGLNENETGHNKNFTGATGRRGVMKKSMRSDSQADAVAAVLLVVLAVAFAVVWVSGQ